MPADHAINDALRAAGPHRTRPIRYERTAAIADWRIKLYTIATHGDVARPALIEETLRRAPAIFPASGDHYGVGFVIVHDAMTASIALYYWWQSFNELHQRVFAGPKADPAAMTQLANQTAGCVWELEVIDFERRAWLADVLANPRGPDVEAYLSRWCETEV
jgi:hypothetical protein